MSKRSVRAKNRKIKVFNQQLSNPAVNSAVDKLISGDVLTEEEAFHAAKMPKLMRKLTTYKRAVALGDLPPVGIPIPFPKKIRAVSPVASVEDRQAFYASSEWRRLRYRVIVAQKGECQACGRSRKNGGIMIHVDHIKPISKFPHLKLVQSNLQLLCEDCNMGKGAWDETDWRDDPRYGEIRLITNDGRSA